MNLAILALFIGIPYGTNASMSIESFLQKRNSNNPLEQIRNPLQWKHDSKRKVSQCIKSHFIALFHYVIALHSVIHCARHSAKMGLTEEYSEMFKVLTSSPHLDNVMQNTNDQGTVAIPIKVAIIKRSLSLQLAIHCQ